MISGLVPETDDLYSIQWKAQEFPPLQHRGIIINDNLYFEELSITAADLNAALKKAKYNKAAGPDTSKLNFSNIWMVPINNCFSISSMDGGPEKL